MLISLRFTFFLKCERSNNLVKLSLKMNQSLEIIWKDRRRPAELPDWVFEALELFPRVLSDDTAEWIKWPIGRPTGRGRSRCFEFTFGGGIGGSLFSYSVSVRWRSGPLSPTPGVDSPDPWLTLCCENHFCAHHLCLLQILSACILKHPSSHIAQEVC